MNSDIELSAETLKWVADAVGRGAEVTSLSLLTGATSSTLYGIYVSQNGRTIELVLRRYTTVQWIEEEPDLPVHEATALQKAGQAGMIVPEWIASDLDGKHCGVPATLMTRLPGRVNLNPPDFERWLYRLAEAIAPLHEVSSAGFGWNYSPYNDLTRLQPPSWSKMPERWQRAIDIVNGPAPAYRECLIHRDYHPCNVLWQGASVSGIVDWPNACIGPQGIDVAWCRNNLAPMYGVETADRFLQVYEAVAGTRFAYHPHWDLMAIIEALPGPPDVYPGWPANGLNALTPALVTERLEAYLASLLRRMDV